MIDDVVSVQRIPSDSNWFQLSLTPSQLKWRMFGLANMAWKSLCSTGNPSSEVSTCVKFIAPSPPPTSRRNLQVILGHLGSPLAQCGTTNATRLSVSLNLIRQKVMTQVHNVQTRSENPTTIWTYRSIATPTARSHSNLYQSQFNPPALLAFIHHHAVPFASGTPLCCNCNATKNYLKVPAKCEHGFFFWIPSEIQMVSSFSPERAWDSPNAVRQFPGNLWFLLEPKEIASDIPGVPQESPGLFWEHLLRCQLFAALSTFWCAPKPGTSGCNGSFHIHKIGWFMGWIGWPVNVLWFCPTYQLVVC